MTEKNNQPTANYRFLVTIDGTDFYFSEATGLLGTYQENSAIGNASASKIKGLRKTANITLKRGLFTNSEAFWRKHQPAGKNAVTPATVTISLVDEHKNVVRSWHVANAAISKINAPSLKSDGNEVAIETLEITHEGLSVN